MQYLLGREAQEGARDLARNRTGRVIDILNWGIEQEYTVILQYLFHSYMTSNMEVKKELEDQAVNEMQHMGWLAEKLIDNSGRPQMEHTEVDQSTKTADMLEVDIKAEREVAVAYDRAAGEVEDPDLKKLLIRLRDQEIYHAEVFSDLLKEEQSQ